MIVRSVSSRSRMGRPT